MKTKIVVGKKKQLNLSWEKLSWYGNRTAKRKKKFCFPFSSFPITPKMFSFRSSTRKKLNKTKKKKFKWILVWRQGNFNKLKYHSRFAFKKHLWEELLLFFWLYNTIKHNLTKIFISFWLFTNIPSLNFSHSLCVWKITLELKADTKNTRHYFTWLCTFFIFFFLLSFDFTFPMLLNLI